jgi:hypothetical protein
MVEDIHFKYSSKKICFVLCKIINDIIKSHELSTSECDLSSLFKGDVSDDFTLEKYLLRIKSLTKLSKASLVYALALVDIFCSSGNILLLKENSFKILFIAIVISYKFNEDIILKDTDLAFVGGISPNELIYLEKEFLEVLNYKVMLSPEVFRKYAKAFTY